MQKHFEANLICMVKERPFLYDKQNKLYFNKSVKKCAWKDISLCLERDVNECRNRWKHLREKFVKDMKRKALKDSVEDVNPCSWAYFEELSFLQDYVQPKKKTKNNFAAIEPYFTTIKLEESTDESPSMENTLKAIQMAAESLKANVNASKDKTMMTNNADTSFCQMLVALINEFPAEAKDEVRTKLFLHLMELKKQYKEQTDKI